MVKHILVVGGAGYIGSHMVRMLLEQGFQPIVFDNLSTGHRDFIPPEVPFTQGDLRERPTIEKVFKEHQIDAVMHFAALSIVSESVQKPLLYEENNVKGCRNLLREILDAKIDKFIFSSSAAVYGESKEEFLTEKSPAKPANPYGETKLAVEHMLQTTAAKEPFYYASLRYFNAAGAHPSGEIGERHNPETHLLPNVLKAAAGEGDTVTIFGNDYPTPDGTCIRDYIHVVDLCRAHLLALRFLDHEKRSGVFNLGSGRGFSVKEVIHTCERVTGREIPQKIGARRAGDPAHLVAGAEKAGSVLGWKPRYSLADMIETGWKWELNIASIPTGGGSE